uniref:Uncharacterized protein n=1 Tax=Rhizophagus irregularis (strain DAOM 181602 / DAOM 197198 / MUCL 43194) TaxID=747089 RepID=U9TWG1_RHIID
MFLQLKDIIDYFYPYFKNLHNRAFEKNTRQIPNASSKEEVNILLQQIKDTNDDGIEDCGRNTNNAEAAHSMVNREGKQLKLLSAILRGKKYDERCYKTIEIHNNTGVPYTHRDKSEIKRTSESIIRKEEPLENEKTEILELEIEEKKIALRERAIKARIAEAEVRKLEAEAEALEIANQQQRLKI